MISWGLPEPVNEAQEAPGRLQNRVWVCGCCEINFGRVLEVGLAEVVLGIGYDGGDGRGDGREDGWGDG